MTASESSRIGLAKQVSKGTAITADASFEYLLFREGGLATANTFLPLDPEVGGGAMQRNVLKTGVMGAGALSFIPRPRTLGTLLYGIFGNVETNQALATVSLAGQTAYALGITQPEKPSKVSLVANGATTASVVIHGHVGVSVDTETIALTGAAPVQSTKTWTSVESYDLPTASSRTVTGSYVVAGTAPQKHVFKHGADQFSTPWFTGRQGVGNMWGEQHPDLKVAGLTLSWRGGRFVDGETAFVGAGVPSKVATTTWAPDLYVDGGPQFISPLGHIELPTGDDVAVTAGSFTGAVSMPIDEQWVVGSYSPQNLDIVQRSYILNLLVKITDGDLANKISLDPAGGSSWVAEAFREADFILNFASYEDIETGFPHRFQIEANGESGADANVVWSARPISMRAGRQIVMSLTGTFLASPDASLDAIKFILVNDKASY